LFDGDSHLNCSKAARFTAGCGEMTVMDCRCIAVLRLRAKYPTDLRTC
jgi:hypothetical protein